MTVSVAVDGERLVVQNRRGSGIHRGLEFYVALFATGCIGEVFVLTVAARDAAVRSCLGQRLFAGRHFVVASAATLNACLGWITAIWTMHNQDLQDSSQGTRDLDLRNFYFRIKGGERAGSLQLLE